MKHNLPDNVLIEFARAIDVPLVYVMKLDANSCLDREYVFNWFLCHEFDRLKSQSNATDASIYEAIASVYGCNRYSVANARVKMSKQSKK